MNLSKPLRSVARLFHVLALQSRAFLPKERCAAFGGNADALRSGIGSIFVINLDRQTKRWSDMIRELEHILDVAGRPASERAIRYSACDARAVPNWSVDDAEVVQFYTLGDQLFVEPQPQAMPSAFELDRSIEMSRAEVAVARSHIGVWKKIARADSAYSLVLEDDVWFERGFGRILTRAWAEIEGADQGTPGFDILYVSYAEVRHGAPKELISENVFRPERGLWYLSGYVLSKKGAQSLLDLLPCRGPVDLWMNHRFRDLDVRALRRSVVNQRRDLHSTNSYSILPVLSKIGILDHSDASLFHRSPIRSPVFAFGAPGSGLTSLAMALSMLGYRCCSDFDDIPERENQRLTNGSSDRVFDAYVNIAALVPRMGALALRYPSAKWIWVGDDGHCFDQNVGDDLGDADLLRLDGKHPHGWRELCEHLKLAPPDAPYPVLDDIGQRAYQPAPWRNEVANSTKRLRYDPLPWVAKARADWMGLRTAAFATSPSSPICFDDELDKISTTRWLLRDDTFPGNLGLFRPANVRSAVGGGLLLTVMEQQLGVRNLSAAALSSRQSYLFGRFEATLQATKIPGLVTGFFLHRNSPRQEIDVEILGDRPDHLLVNVFYNPGTEGAKFDYGYRGTPALIKLGFDASEAPHRFAIEWTPSEIRWFVDQKLVHRRVVWNPTPIPHLPMALHVNNWPTRSRELGGRLALRKLPASAIVRRLTVDSHVADAAREPNESRRSMLIE